MITVIVTIVWVLSLGFMFAYGVLVGEGRELDRENAHLTREYIDLIRELNETRGD